MITKRIIFSLVLLFVLPLVSQAAMTYSASEIIEPSNVSFITSMNSDLNPVYKFCAEVETILEAWTIAAEENNIITFANGATISNATDHALIFVEKAEQFKWVFADTSITASSSTGVVLFDSGTMVRAANQFLVNPISAAVGTVEGTIRYDSDDDKFYGRDNDSWVQFGASAGTPAGSDTHLQYNNASSFGGISTIIWDDTNLEFADDQNIAFGTSAEWTGNYDDSVADQFLWETTKIAAIATGDPMWQILVDTGHASGTSLTAEQDVFGVAKGSQGTNVDLFVVDAEGDGTFAGDLTVGGTFYQAAIAAAASGNLALALDAAGNSGVGINQTGTGDITLYRDTVLSLALDVAGATTLDGAVTLGDASGDNITFSGTVVSGITLDDGTTDSPALTLQDATNETLVIVKLDNGDTTVTIPADTNFEIVAGNLAVGNGSPTTCPMDGDDFYVKGDSEMDGYLIVDGALTLGSTLSVTDTATFAENITFTVGADEYMKLDADTTEHTETAGVLDIDLKSKTDNTAAINLAVNYMTGGGDHDVVGILIDLDDDANAAAELIGIEIGSSDDNASAVTKAIKIQNTVEVGAQMIMGVAATALDIDAPLQTQTDGTIDIDFSSVTNGAEAINIDVDVGDTQAGSEIITGILIDLDDDTVSQTSAIRGFSAVSSDVTGQASTLVTGFYTSGCDAALDAINGYVAIGTVATADVTPGDDDLYVKGTLEVDGASRIDGNIDLNADIVGAGPTTYIEGMVAQVEEYDGAGNTITIVESGKTFTNEGDADGSLHTLPEASTAIGCTYTFVVTVAQNLVVDLDNADIFLHLTLGAGDKIQSATVGDSITVRALDDSDWAVISVYPLASDWIDGGP